MLAGLVLAVYANSFSTGFPFDNKFMILDDPRVHRATRENVASLFTQDIWWPKGVSGLYRPLTKLSFMLNYAVLGNADRPAGYHALNLLLHWTNGILVYVLALRVLRGFWPAAWTAALFATHPIATEAVTNIVGRADLLAALSVLGGLLLAVASARRRGWRAAPWLIGLALTTALGLLCKEIAVTVAGVVVLYDVVFQPSSLRAAIPRYLALVLPMLMILYVRARLYATLPSVDFPFVDNPMVAADFWTARMTAIKVIGKDLWLLVLPRALSCDYSYDQVPLFGWQLVRGEDAKALVALAVILAASAVVVHQYRRANGAVAFFVAWVLVTLAPSANLVKVIGSIMAERFLYLPSIGFCACLATGMFALARRLGVASTLLALVVAAYGMRTSARNPDWQDAVRLWSSAARVSPRSFKTHQSLASALYAKGGAGHDDIDTVIKEAEAARTILLARPLPAVFEDSSLFLDLGRYYQAKAATAWARLRGERTLWYQRSAEALEEASRVDRARNEASRRKDLLRGRDPAEVADLGNYWIYWYLGLADMELARYPQARDAFAYMRHLAPDNSAAYRGIARAEVAAGEPSQAVVPLLQALAIDPNDREARGLLVDVYRQIDPAGCTVERAPQAAKVDPSCPRVHEDVCAAYRNLLGIFVESRQQPRARELAHQAIERERCAPEDLERALRE